jgi:opacity protein-like surface antigen
MNKVAFCIIILMTWGYTYSYAQTDTADNELEQEIQLHEKVTRHKAKKQYVSYTFKSTHLINSQTVENLNEGVLDLRILHRFGVINNGAANFFGMDNATTKMALDYGIKDWLMVGLAHSTLNSEDDGFIKFRLLRQERHEGMPFTLSFLSGMSIHTGPAPLLIPSDKVYYFSNRLYFANQLILARKFTPRFSFQLMPTMVHYNLVDSTHNSNNVYAMGFGARLKIAKRLALTGEYFYQFPGTESLTQVYNSFSLGIDIETGGHVFQLLITNSPGMTERAFIGQTQDSWSKGQLHLGFNISRVFALKKQAAS